MTTFKNLLFEDLEKNNALRNIKPTYHIPQKKVNCKIIQCGNYIQFYIHDKHYYVNEKGYEKLEDNLIIEEKYIKDYKLNLKQIEFKNLNRSKNNMTRLINTNIDKFTSFLTLTFNEDITDLTIANKEFDKFITKIKRNYKEFLYVAVPEFQKNGRIHYHMLTNINYYNSSLIQENLLTSKLYQNKNESQIQEFIENNTEKKLLKKYNKKDLNKLDYCYRLQNGKYENTKCSFSKKKNDYNIFKTIRYWKNGFSNIIPTDNINIVGYMSKYMMEDFDNRLFGRNRYLHGGALEKPIENYLNFDNEEDLKKFVEIYNNSTIQYQNTYKDTFGNNIEFIEIKLN